MAKVTIHIPDNLMARVEESRGDVSRSKFIQRALEAALRTGFTHVLGTVVDEQVPPRSIPCEEVKEMAESPPKAREVADKLGLPIKLPTASQLAKQGVKPIPKR